MNYRVCFTAYLRRHGRRESTVRTYVRALEEFCTYSERSGRRLGMQARLRPEQVEAYKQYLLREGGLRPATVNQRLSALSAFARFLICRGILSGNPLELVSRVGRASRNTAAIIAAWEDVQRVRAQVHSDMLSLRDRAIVELLYAGLTVRELCSLRYDRLWSPDNSKLRVGERVVSLHARACLALEHYLRLRPILKGHYLIVGNGAENALQHSSVYGTVRRLARLAGVRVGVKDLRQGRYVAEVLGFSPAFIAAGVAA